MPAQLAGQLKLLGASFNENSECFSIGHDSGFRVYNGDPMESWVSRDFSDGGVRVVGMLHRTNFLALVGGGNRPKFPPNKVVLWDDIKEAPVMTLEFPQEVLNVILTRTRILVVLQTSVHLYALTSPPQQLTSYETTENSHGIAAVHKTTAAFPSPSIGRIQLIDLETGKVIGVLRAHKSPLRAISVRDHLVASASTTGTIIRVFDCRTKALVHEFRRGLDRAEIYSLAMGSDNLAVLSDKSTLHVFALAGENRSHLLKKLPIGQRYFGSSWSYASCQTENDGPGVLGWVSENAVVIVWIDTGRWEKYVVLPGNELVREAWRRLEAN